MGEVAEIPDSVRALWAKKNDKNGCFEWLPLLVHLKDTMNVADFLWNHWMTQGQRDSIVSQMHDGSEEAAERLIRFLGGIHDIGKATPSFQTQKGYSSSVDLDNELLEKLEFAGFHGIRDCTLVSAAKTHHTIAGAVILNQLGVKDDITSIVCGHHGKPADSISEYQDQITAYVSNYYQDDNPDTGVYQLWKNVHEWIFQWALDQSEEYELNNLPSLSLPAQVLLCGLVIMADWIASNEKYFPLIGIHQDTIDDETIRFQSGIRKWFRDQPLDVQQPVSSEKLFQERFGFSPRAFQTTIFETVETIDNPGIVIIEAPTGCGKTEAALATAEQLAAKTHRSGLFFGLPTQATANSIFSRVYPWLASVVKDYDNTQSLRLQHGKALLNPLMNQLTSHHGDGSNASNVDIDEGSDNSVIVNQWFSGRKTASLDDFVVGTVDQFLLTALKQKHLMLRHLGFDKKVVIIDEVHAYDSYMQQYLTMALEWMGAYGVPVILLSATLPVEKRKEFIRCYLAGKGIKKRDIALNDADLQTDQYPLLTYTDGSHVLQTSDFQMAEHRTVKIHKITQDVLFDTVSSLVNNGGVIGIIVNTVKRSQEIAKQFVGKYGKKDVLLLHSSFISADRVNKESKLLEKIGKGGNRPQRLIVVGTQVIEQSLDIDFDAMITDLCPMDLLIQRIGRLQRHSIHRPPQYQQATLYLMGADTPLVFDAGTSHVYQPYLLARTQYFLPDEIRIPYDVSPLVQKVYDLSETDPVYQGQEQVEYAQAKEKFKIAADNKKFKAKSFQIGSPSLKINPERRNLIGWLTTPDESETEEAAYAQVRDTEETIEVIAVRKYGDDYGFFSAENEKERDIAANIDNEMFARKLAAQTIRLPRSITLTIQADTLIQWLEQYNLQYLASWQNQPWLKGALGLIFDEHGDFSFEEYHIKLHYDNMYGLQVEKEEKE